MSNITNSFVSQIPVYIRGGHIIPMRNRIRRAALLTLNDPFTLLITLNNNVSIRWNKAFSIISVWLNYLFRSYRVQRSVNYTWTTEIRSNIAMANIAIWDSYILTTKLYRSELKNLCWLLSISLLTEITYSNDIFVVFLFS